MTRSLVQNSFNQDELANEWEEAFHSKSRTTTASQFSQFNAIFSDDEEEDPRPQRWIPEPNILSSNVITGYIDPVLSSSTYHIHQADNALLTLKHIVAEEGWKKALKHKSGVIVHMKNGIHKGDKTPIFKGEAIIQGFSPQAIFYVIGMRKLWDEQYEDGNLVENLNDTTSLTYEIMKPTTTSKSRDLALVEKIECTQNGAIVFACTSIETPRIPRMNGRTRVNTKLQGWILEPLHGGPNPATKVVFVVQESMKGWVPGFAKKTLARRPLVIAKVAEYLERKTERMRSTPINNNNQSGLLQSLNHGHSRRPSVMSNHTPIPQQFNRNRLSPQRELNQSILAAKSLPTLPPTTKKHISFADHDITYTPSNKLDQDINSNSSTTTDSNSTIPQLLKNKVSSSVPAAKQHLYPSHRHPIQKVESIQLLKKLTYSNDNWQLTKELKDGSKHYILNSNILSDDEDDFINHHNQHGGELLKRKAPFIRVDGVIDGGWTAEQLCSVIHCFGSRKIWDSSFEGGQTIERFSQKEYLVQWFLGGMLPIASVDLSAITSIESDPITGTVYTATTSVTDQQVPPDESGHRIRAYNDLYGWVFRPKFDKEGRTISVGISFVCNMDFRYTVPSHVLQTWIDSSLQSITHIHHYLSQYGCPPYIRRVAGKVIREGFDALTNNYQIVFTAKHQPSNSYRARKQQQQQQNQSVWCTDIRVHKTMFPHGLDISVIPENVARIEVSPKDNKSIKIFTTDQYIDGKQVTFTLVPLSSTDGINHHSSTYKYNGELFNQRQAIADKQETIEIVSEPSNTIEEVVDQVVEVIKKEIQISTPALPATIQAEITKDENLEGEEAIPLKVPKGYLLVPEHQPWSFVTIWVNSPHALPANF
ncbi:hypothetical protein INT48_003285 [Thamnidium elegans]|uniref:START domain-containing protein n=1 Tax=Thamnidium elegans TaxID=101142 RepID=A0A8H7VNI3_9FUNG|nr:hypothetical protein INT48_003285 [Thamnidium elegans]